jgi:allophanate hydrolase subunit 2
MSRALTVLRTGALTLVTDLGRPGHAHLGVPRAGALDEPALRLANRLVGNPEGAAGLEVLLGGCELRAEVPCTVAVTGPPTAVTVTPNPGDGPGTPNSGSGADFGPGTPHSGSGDGPGDDPAGGIPEADRSGGTGPAARPRAVGTHRAVRLQAGDRLAVAPPGAGLRNYLAVDGGLDVPAVLGSRSADLLSGLGPAPLAEGDRLPLGPPAEGPPDDAEPVPVSVPPPHLEVPVLLGPRDGWLDAPAEALRAALWTVESASNRVGLRLSGPALRRHPDHEGAELPSEPVRPGAVQVPPSGRPVIFLADAPTTGGYPVAGVVADRWLPALGQARPGTTLRLRPT